MKLPIVLAICLLSATLAVLTCQPAAFAAPPADQFETRCGWLSNPTPGNVWLYDRDGDWTIAVQGGYQIEGDWDWPEFPPGQWVATNGSHGYGCACLRLRVDPQTHQVVEIQSSRAKPLAACRQDRSLSRWKELFK